MHCHKALNDFFEVLPFFLVCVIVSVGFDFRRKSIQLNSSSTALPSLDSNLFSSDRILDHDDTIIQTWLLFHNYVGWMRRLGQLFLSLIEHRGMLALFLLQLWVIIASHLIECFPTSDLSSLSILFDSNFLKATTGRRAGGSRGKSHTIVIIAVTALHVDDANATHLAVALRVIWN